MELVKRLDANVAINYCSKRFEVVATDCDVALDSAGGDTLVKCFECVKPGGVVASINSSIPSPAFARSCGLNPVIVFAIRMLSRKTLAAARKHEARYGYMFVRASSEQLREVALWVERGAITPLVDGPWARGGARCARLLRVRSCDGQGGHQSCVSSSTRVELLPNGRQKSRRLRTTCCAYGLLARPRLDRGVRR